MVSVGTDWPDSSGARMARDCTASAGPLEPEDLPRSTHRGLRRLVGRCRLVSLRRQGKNDEQQDHRRDGDSDQPAAQFSRARFVVVGWFRLYSRIRLETPVRKSLPQGQSA